MDCKYGEPKKVGRKQGCEEVKYIKFAKSEEKPKESTTWNLVHI